MSKRVFFQNAAIMTVTSLILRSIGILFRIFVSNRIGAEGMGLYQMIVSVYVLASSFATTGLNTAVTRLCTDAIADGRSEAAGRILRRCILLSLLIAFISGGALYFGSDWIGDTVLHDTRAALSVRVLTLGLPFMGVSSCIKGYFLARRRVTGASLAQILEQLVRIVATVSVLELFQVQTVELACFAVMLGDTVAEASSCLYMGLCCLLDKRRLSTGASREPWRPDLKEIGHIAVPITTGRYINSGLRTLENILVPDTLTQCIGSRETALSLFGKLKGMTMPLLFFPSSFLNAFSTLLIPEISEAKALHHVSRMQRTVQRSLRVTILSSVWIGGLFFATADPLSMLVYGDSDVGGMLRALAPLTPLMYLESVVVGLLKGLDQQTHSLIYSIVDSASRIAMILWLLPRCGMVGFFGVMYVSNLLTCALNLHRLHRVTSTPFCLFAWLLKPSAAIVLAVLLLQWLPPVTSSPVFSCIWRTVIISAAYGCLLKLFGCLNHRESSLVSTCIKPKKGHGT